VIGDCSLEGIKEPERAVLSVKSKQERNIMSTNEETTKKAEEETSKPEAAEATEEPAAAAAAAPPAAPTTLTEEDAKKDDDNDPTVSAQTTEEALAAAVAASAGVASEQPAAAGTTAAAAAEAAAAVVVAAAAADPMEVDAVAPATTTTTLTPTDRDVILGEGSAGHKTNLLLQDIIRLHRILWKLHDKAPPTTRDEVKEMAIHIIELIQNGKSFELAGLKDVPKQFMKSTGRFFGPNPNSTTNTNGGGDWVLLPQEEIQKTMCDIILEDFKVDDLGPLTDMPYKDLKEWITKKQDKDSNAAPFMPEGRDAILLPCRDLLGEKMYEHQAGNKTLFHLASQLVTSYSNSPEKRVEAALLIMKGLDDAETISIGEKEMTTTSKTRYLIRTQREDQSIAWDIMDAVSAAEFTLIFTFEVFLEKEIHILPPSQIAGAGGVFTSSFPQELDDITPESIGPVPEPTDHDVLFGRGGMTNSHPGNRRFRDIIALHRPDYIRAVKMDKPSVARKIVRAIRYGNPPGRFLKKSDDGLWYDCGDRTAAEKTSQGLRERSNAEKRQRSALREALRIRKQDMAEDDDHEQASKKAKGDSSTAELIAASIAPTLNYVGTNLPVPLSLTMKEPVTVSRKKAASTPKKDGAGKPVPEELNTEGLPPNAVDEEGNILVTGALQFLCVHCR